MQVRPYPYQRLPRLRRRELATLREVRERARGGEAALSRWLSALLGAPAQASTRTELLATDDEGERRALLAGAAAVVALRGAGGERGLLLLDGKLAAIVLGLLLRSQPAPLAGLATTAQRGLLIYAVAGVLLELGEGCAWTVELGEGPPPLPTTGPALEVAVSLGAGRQGTAWLLLDELRLRPRQAPAASAARHRLLAGARLEAAVELGRVSLAASELMDLAAGDLLLSPACPAAGQAWRGLLRVGQGGFPIVIEGGALRVEERFIRGPRAWEPLRGGASMTTDPDTVPQTGDDVDHDVTDTVADALQVELVLELGRLPLSGAQVLQLAPGDVLALGRPLGAPLDLRVGDRLIARGELVDVEGETGVRLVEVFE